MKFSE